MKKSKVKPEELASQSENRSPGSYYVRVYSSGKWALYLETWKGNSKEQIKVPPAVAKDMGFQPNMTAESARENVRLVNKFQKKSKQATRKKIAASERVSSLLNFNQTLFPENLVREFLEKIETSSEGADRFIVRLRRSFQVVQEIATELKIDPSQYSKENMKIFSIFKNRKYSVSYSKDIVWMFNKWGQFWSLKKSTFFEPIPKIRIRTQSSLSENQRDKQSVRKISKPMTIPILKKIEKAVIARSKTDNLRYNWLEASFLFGLRPSECDAVFDKAEVEYDSNGTAVLAVIQTKIASADSSGGIKRIPVLCKEQEISLEKIIRGEGVRPTPGWVKAICNEQLGAKGAAIQNFDLYCGRKGFVDFMLFIGQEIHHASVFAGHRSLSTTWKYYKDRDSVKYNKNPYVESRRKQTG